MSNWEIWVVTNATSGNVESVQRQTTDHSLQEPSAYTLKIYKSFWWHTIRTQGNVVPIFFYPGSLYSYCLKGVLVNTLLKWPPQRGPSSLILTSLTPILYLCTTPGSLFFIFAVLVLYRGIATSQNAPNNWFPFGCDFYSHPSYYSTSCSRRKNSRGSTP